MSVKAMCACEKAVPEKDDQQLPQAMIKNGIIGEIRPHVFAFKPAASRVRGEGNRRLS
jgi:hypothetical protein